jgi:RNA polymerase sigma-70 factor (ECF subfamily)
MSAELLHDLDSLEGFERLYRTYYGYAWAVLARLGVPSALVDDAHQDVFVTAYRRRDTFQRGRPVKPWLVGIARRVAFRYRRSQRRSDRKQSALTHASGRERLAAASVHGRVEAGQFLQAFMDGLEPEQREVFVLAELEGHSGPEVAERLGINLNTAYTRLRAVRGQLRRALDAVEERRVPEARVERSLALVLPQLSKPGWLAGLGAGLVKAKAGVMIGVAVVGIAAAVVIGVGSRDGGADGGRASRAGVAASRVGDVDAKAGAPASGIVEEPPRAFAAETALVPSVEPMRAPSTVPAAEAARPETPASAARAEAGPRNVAAVPGTASNDAETTPDLQREVEQLTAAREALAAGRAADALALLEAHARTHPSSTLAEGRAALRIACLCALGRREQARGEAVVLLRSHPGSTLARHAVTRCDEPNP